MTVGTPVSKIIETIQQVEVMQGQLRTMTEAVDRLANRVLALEQAAGGSREGA